MLGGFTQRVQYDTHSVDSDDRDKLLRTRGVCGLAVTHADEVLFVGDCWATRTRDTGGGGQKREKREREK